MNTTKMIATIGLTVLTCMVLYCIGWMTHTMAMTANEQAFGGYAGWLGPVAGAVWMFLAGMFFMVIIKE